MDCPHFIACLDLRDRNLDYDFLRKIVGEWRQYAPNYLCDFYPMTSYTTANDAWIAWQFDRPESGQGVVQAFRRANSIYESARFKLRALDPKARYVVADLDKPDAPQELAGGELMDKGLLVTAETQPAAMVFAYRKKEPSDGL